MPDLLFKVASAEPADSAGAAQLCLRLAITNRCAGEHVHSIALTVQLQIEPARRRYTDAEKLALDDLFGEPSRWPTTVRPLYWTTLTVTVPAFVGATEFELCIPSVLEPGFAAARYINALQTGEVPVLLLFSGRVLYLTATSLQMFPIPWSQEAPCRVPLHLMKRTGPASSELDVARRETA
jgi:hypothetical protein